MIIDFSISNYRSIKEMQTLSFEATNDSHLENHFVVTKGKYRLLKIATLLGANASGKSNVIKAFMLFPILVMRPCEDKTSKINYSRFALDETWSDRDTTIVLNFICGEKKYHYELSFNNDLVTHELLKCEPFGAGLGTRKVFERYTDRSSLIASVTLGGKYKSSAQAFREMSVNLLHNRTVFGAFQKSNIDIPWLKEIIDWVGSYWLPNIETTDQNLSDFTSEQIQKGRIRKEDVVDILRKADIGVKDITINEQIKDLPKEVIEFILNSDKAPEDLKKQVKDDPTSKELEVKLLHGGRQGLVPLDFSEESRGTQRYYELLSVLLLIVKEPHFIAIDELESRMHPDLYEHFIVTYLNNATESQMVFSTHMREFLSDRDMFRDDSVWFAEKTDEGATELFSLVDFGSDILRNDSSRYNAYRSGRLGAVPRLGDINIQ